MSAASLVMLSRESEPSSKKTSKNLRVNQPGDAFEREADRVADTVSSGGHIPGWSLASTGADQIQRDSNTASALPGPQPIRQIGDPLPMIVRRGIPARETQDITCHRVPPVGAAADPSFPHSFTPRRHCLEKGQPVALEFRRDINPLH